MKNFKLNLKGLYGYRQSLLSRSPQPRDNREMSERRPSEERTLLASVPQRFARYAAMLIMLLTIGVGQIWADTYHLAYQKDMPSSNWNADHYAEMTQSSNNSNRYYYTVSLDAGSNYGFFIVKNYTGADKSGEYYKASATAYDNEKVSLTKYDGDYGGSPNRVTFTTNSAGTYIFTYDIDTKEIFVSPQANQSITMYYVNTNGGNTYDGYYCLPNSEAMTQSGSLHTVDLDLQNQKYYMYLYIQSGRTNTYWRGKTTLVVDNNQVLYHYNSGDCGGSEKVNFKPSAAGTYRFTWNHLDKTIKLNRKFTVTYYGNGNTSGSMTEQTILSGTATALTANSFSKDNYSFVGWNTQADGSGVSYTNEQVVTLNASTGSDLTLYAQWKQTVTLGENGSVVVKYNNAGSSLLSAPTKTGYHIATEDGYYAEVGCTNKVMTTDGALVDYSGYVASGKWVHDDATTLHPKWTANTWYIRFNGNSNTGGSMSDQEFTYDASATALTTCAFTRTGYTFAGWATSQANADSKTKTYDDEEAVSNLTSAQNGIVDLYAIWEPNKYTITLHNGCAYSNGTLDGGGELTNFVVTYGTQYFEHNMYTSPSATAYEFGGWYSADGGSGDLVITNLGALVDGTTVYTDAEGKWNHAGNVDLYAKWSMTLSTVGYISGGSYIYNPGSITFVYNAEAPSAFTAATRMGYILQGYWTAADGGSKVINADGSFVESITDWTDAEHKWIHSGSTPTLYVRWEPITYYIAFDAGTLPSHLSEATGSMARIDATYDEYVTLPANGFTRPNYVFWGWATSAGGDFRYGDQSETVINLTSVNDEEVTLYALWTGLDYTVTLNPRGGEVSQTSMTVAYGSAYGTGSDLIAGELPTPYKAGYRFDGWFTAADGGTQVTKESIMSTAGDHTLYAHYTEETRVYFLNTLGWSEVYVTYSANWTDARGAGNQNKIYHRMNILPGTSNIYYDVIPELVVGNWQHNIAFNSQQLGNLTDGYTGNYESFDAGEAVFRMDFDSRATMFVPTNNTTNGTEGNYQKNGVQYYSTAYTGSETKPEYTSGYWRTYNDTYSGYFLTYQKNGGDWITEKHLNAEKAGDNIFVYSADLDANSQYNFSIRKHCKTSNEKANQFRYNAEINSTNCTDIKLSSDYNNAWMRTTIAGRYIFKLEMKNDGHMYLSIDYPFGVNDYKVVYSYTKDGAKTFDSEYIKARANGKDTISMFIHSGDSATARSLYIQKCTAIAAGVATWNTTYASIALPTETAEGKTSGVYNFEITQDESSAASGVSIGKYEGEYYIRTESADGGWDQYKNRADNVMTFSEYSLKQTLSAPYSHYFCKYIGGDKVPISADITFTVATDYSPSICPVMVGDAIIGGLAQKTLPSGNPASVRFMWNEETNATNRSYLKSATGAGNTRFLVLHGKDGKIYNEGGSSIAADGGKSLEANELLFEDKGSWVYELKLKAQPGAQVSLIARYNGETDRYLIGGATSYETIIGGSGETKYLMDVLYDFKTNRLITAWKPTAGITDQLTDIDVIIERHDQDDPTTITFRKASASADPGSITAKSVIGSIRFVRSELVGQVASWNETTRAKMMFLVSFPFDVNVADIFGLNTNYGEAFIIQKYNGEKRAKEGFFAGDGTSTFWETMTTDEVMKANVGYCVCMDNDYLNGDLGNIWDNNPDEVFLYFPSASGNISINSEDKTIEIPVHDCKIDRAFGKLNHKYTDSNWNMMGVPIFETHTGNATAGTPGAIFSSSSAPIDSTTYKEHPDFGYFYNWNTDKTFTVQSAVGFVFKPMFSYLVQYAGNVKFTCEVLSADIAARKGPNKENYKIDLQVLNTNEEVLNRTYVELRENACDTFSLNEDLYMAPNSHAVNIYTFAGDYDVAANVMSINSHIVPVGVIVRQAGTYTFSMPSRFSGTVTLVDTYTGTRTNLSMRDYEVNLPVGTNVERFLLEIDIKKVATAIDGCEEGSLRDGKAHKFIQNGVMYIFQNGILYDAQGKRVQ